MEDSGSGVTHEQQSEHRQTLGHSTLEFVWTEHAKGYAVLDNFVCMPSEEWKHTDQRGGGY